MSRKRRNKSGKKRYPSDLSEGAWKKLQTLLPVEKKNGRPRTVSLRKVLNGIFYVLKTGC